MSGRGFATRSINALVHTTRPLPELTAGNSALLIVDMSYKDAHTDYGIGRLLQERGWEDTRRDYFARVEAIISKIQRLRATCHDVGMKVLYTRVAASTPDCSDMGRAFKRIGVKSPAIWAPLGSREAQILEQLAPDLQDIVVSKTTGKAFNCTNIDWILRNAGVENVVVTGVSIYDGALDAPGYETILVSDATTALTVQEHEDLLRRRFQVGSTDQIIAAISAGSHAAAPP